MKLYVLDKKNLEERFENIHFGMYWKFSVCKIIIWSNRITDI